MSVRVLLLDDERSVRRAFHLLLEEAGHEVWSAGTAMEARLRLDSTTFDVAVVDIVMARGGGHRLLEVLRRRHPEVGVIAITGDPAVFADLEHDPSLDVCLVKPVTRRVLLDAVIHAQAARSARQSGARLRLGATGRLDRPAGGSA